MRNKGDRVGAIQKADEKTETVWFFGYGTYEGDEIPPENVKLFGISLFELGLKNPKIILDSGKIVWGCECWWGGEETVKKSIGDRNVIIVDPDEARNEGDQLCQNVR